MIVPNHQPAIVWDEKESPETRVPSETIVKLRNPKFYACWNLMDKRPQTQEKSRISDHWMK